MGDPRGLTLSDSRSTPAYVAQGGGADPHRRDSDVLSAGAATSAQPGASKITSSEESTLATYNFKHDKRQRELAKQKKKAEKRQRRLDRKTTAPEDMTPGQNEPPTSEPTGQ